MTTAPTSGGNFFTHGARKTSPVRLFRNKFLTGLCCSLSLLTLVPLFSIVYLVIKNGLSLMSLDLFTQLPPAPGTEGGGFGNAIVGTIVMVLLG